MFLIQPALAPQFLCPTGSLMLRKLLFIFQIISTLSRKQRKKVSNEVLVLKPWHWCWNRNILNDTELYSFISIIYCQLASIQFYWRAITPVVSWVISVVYISLSTAVKLNSAFKLTLHSFTAYLNSGFPAGQHERPHRTKDCGICLQDCYEWEKCVCQAGGLTGLYPQILIWLIRHWLLVPAQHLVLRNQTGVLESCENRTGH